ncbi:hypothetical protein ABIA32_002117 [Streptacidiphilus sp. MAP12-20]|uniref:hypothetical protein n=1 Tax=Streptacidiphilus sp. MAP12-20 TaxID=3156299 RepID=UPI003518D9E1
MHTYQRILGATAACLAVMLGSSACSMLGGSSTPSSNAGAVSSTPSPTGVSADALASNSVADLGSAASVRLVGNVTSSSRKMTLNLQLVAGKGCAGTIAMGSKGSFKMTLLGTKLWVLPDKAFWVGVGAHGSKLTEIEGKYIGTTISSKAFGNFATLCDAKTLAGHFGNASGMTRGAGSTIDGQSVVAVQDPVQGTAYITDTTTPHLVRLSMPGASGGQIDFLDYNKPAVITAPHASLTVPGSKFGF